MTGKSTRLGACLGALLLCGCAEWSTSPANQDQQQARGIWPFQKPKSPAPDPDLENAPLGDTLDPPADTIATEAVRQYLADLESANTSDPNAAPGTAPRVAQSRPSAPPAEPRARTQPAAPPQPEVEVTVADTSAGASTAPQAAQANAPLEIGEAGKTQTRSADAAAGPADRPQIVAVSLVGNATPATITSGTSQHQPATVGGSGGQASASLDRAIAETRAQLAADASNAELQWRLGLLQLAAGRISDAGDVSRELTEKQRGLLARQVAVEAALSDLLRGNAAGPSAAFAAVEALADALRSDAELELPTLALCTKVTTFGVYDELPDALLRPYQANRAIVYCEIRNLATQKDNAGLHHSALATRLELFTEDGRSLWNHVQERIEDTSRRRRQDFFIAQLVTFPADLGPGTYVLKATVTDLLADKTNETSRRITVGGEAAMAASAAP